jgi:hypothetical protein
VSSSTLASLSVNFVLSASISFVDAGVAVLLPARTRGFVEVLGVDAAESLFFTSATAEVEEDEAAFEMVGRGAVLLVLAVSLEEVPLAEIEVLLAAFGLVTVLAELGLRTVVVDVGAPRFSARVSVFAGGLWEPEDASEVLLALLDDGFFLSSPDPPTEVCDLCPVLEDVEAVAVVGFLTVDPGTARTGGLVNPLVEVWVADDDIGLVPDVEVADGRFAAISARLGGTFSFFSPLTDFFDKASLSVSVSISDATVFASSLDCFSTVASPWGTTGGSTSAILDRNTVVC